MEEETHGPWYLSRDCNAGSFSKRRVFESPCHKYDKGFAFQKRLADDILLKLVTKEAG